MVIYTLESTKQSLAADTEIYNYVKNEGENEGEYEKEL